MGSENSKKFRLEDLFEKSDMKMENGNMGSESSRLEDLEDSVKLSTRNN